MPRGVTNETLGECPCPIKGCDAKAALRKTKGAKPKWYSNCPEHGPVFLNTPKGQEWFLDNGNVYGAVRPEEIPKGAPPASVEPPKAPPPAPAPEPTPAPPAQSKAPPAARAKPAPKRPAFSFLDDI